MLRFQSRSRTYVLRKWRAQKLPVVAVRKKTTPNGQWNYEIVVITGGKEWGFEVDPNGTVPKKHTEETLCSVDFYFCGRGNISLTVVPRPMSL